MSSTPAPRFYYGWVIVAVAGVMNLASSPATAVTFGFFIRPMGDDLGWSAGELALGLTFRLAVASITSPILGFFLDRLGTRLLGTVAAIVAGLTIIGVGFVHELWMFYLLYAISGLSGFGGPSGQLLTVVPVAKWFNARRGRALGIAAMGTPAGNLLLIPIAQFIIDAYGWRTAWVVLGGLLVAVAAPACAIFMRKDPESLGLRVDGAPALAETETQAAQRKVTEEDDGWTVRQAMRSQAFWLLVIATAFTGIVTQGTLVHRVPFWQDIGIASGYVAAGTAMAPLLVVIAGLWFGILADRWPVGRIGLLGGIITALSAAPMIVATNNVGLLVIHNVLWGIGQGANNTVANVVWPSYFGRKYLGSIRGIIFPVAIGTAAISAPLFAVMLAVVAEPRLVWIVPFVGFLVSGLLFFVTKAPKRDESGRAAVVAPLAP